MPDNTELSWVVLCNLSSPIQRSSIFNAAPSHRQKLNTHELLNMQGNRANFLGNSRVKFKKKKGKHRVAQRTMQTTSRHHPPAAAAGRQSASRQKLECLPVSLAGCTDCAAGSSCYYRSGGAVICLKSSDRTTAVSRVARVQQ